MDASNVKTPIMARSLFRRNILSASIALALIGLNLMPSLDNQSGSLPYQDDYSNFSINENKGKEEGKRRKVVLLGPHDRYNFGDLLFEKVLSNLLMTHNGYQDHEIIRAGIISTNMSAHGGYPNILSMKKVLELSHSSPGSSFDVIYTGGESSGCSITCGIGMLPTDELQEQAAANRIYDCAYLVPKEFLVPKILSSTIASNKTKNVAIANSLGGYPGLSVCNKAIETADHVSLRDREPLVPDCAVMTKELFGDHVSSVRHEVTKDLFPNGNQNEKYIAVQFTSAFGTKLQDKIAKVLDDIARRTNCTIVFFAAGTAPYHDSFEIYESVSSQMKEANVVYRTENVWNVVATVSGAVAVIGTSLHVRIMSFIYHKPRITWCKDEKRKKCSSSKHAHFIDMWDASNSRTLRQLDDTWSTLTKYLGKTPEISQDETKDTYHSHVSKYMENFFKWSSLLG